MKQNAKAGIIMATVMILSASGVFLVEVSDAEEVIAPTQIDAADFIVMFSDGALKLDKDYELNDALAITGTVTLDLAGHKLVNGSASNTITVSDGGKLTVMDSVGGGIVDNVTHATAAIFVNVGGEATLNGGTFERSKEAGTDKDTNGDNSCYTILNHGKLTINSGATVKNGDAKTTGRYSSMISNGFYTASENTTKADVVLTINGGTFVGGLYNVKNDDYGVLTINGGTFQASAGLCNILNWNDITITGGSFSSEDAVLVAFDTPVDYNKGVVKISGGKFDCKNEIVYLGIGKDTASYTVDISFDGIQEGRTVLNVKTGVVMNGTVSVNKNAVQLTNIIAGDGFLMAVGSIDIEGAYTSTENGSIVVNGDAKLSGTIDSNVTVKVSSGSITVPEGKSLTGTIQMGAGNTITLSDVTAGTDGIVVTPSTISGKAVSSTDGTMSITGTVSVASTLSLDGVDLSIPEGSTLKVPADATVSAANGGSVANAGSMSIDGKVASPVSNTGTVRASAGAVVDSEISGDYNHAKPVIQEINAKRIALGGSINIYVSVSDGADVELSGTTWAKYENGCIVGTPDKAGQYTIVATPVINGNVGDSVSFRVIVDSPSTPEPEPEPEKKDVTEIDITPITTLLILVLGAVIIVMIVRAFA